MTHTAEYKVMIVHCHVCSGSLSVFGCFHNSIPWQLLVPGTATGDDPSLSPTLLGARNRLTIQLHLYSCCAVCLNVSGICRDLLDISAETQIVGG